MSNSFSWGGIKGFPISDANKHFCVMGATGSGKTVNIRLLLQEMLPLVGHSVGGKRLDHRATLYDAKQEMLGYLLPIMGYQQIWERERGTSILSAEQALGQGWLPSCIKLVNPFDRRCAAWDMAADVTNPASAQQVAAILVPEDAQSNNPFFAIAARHLLYGVLLSFIEWKKKTQQSWTFRQVLLTLRSEQTLRAALMGCPHTRHLVGLYLNDGDTLNSIKATLATKLMPYEVIAALWSRAKERFSLQDFCEGDRRLILVLGNDERNREAIDAMNRVLFKRLSEIIISQPDSDERRTWVILDEVREMGKLEGLTSLLLRGRSKGACVVLGFQDIDGMRDVYGEFRAHEIVGQCAFKALLKLESPTTAEWAAKHFGVTEQEKDMSSDGLSLGTGNVTLTSGTGRQLIRRDEVIYIELMAIETASRKAFTGFFVSPDGRYKQTVPIGNHLLGRVSGVDFMPRQESDQYLDLWGAGELEQMDLAPTLRDDLPKPDRVSGPRDLPRD